MGTMIDFEDAIAAAKGLGVGTGDLEDTFDREYDRAVTELLGRLFLPGIPTLIAREMVGAAINRSERVDN